MRSGLTPDAGPRLALLPPRKHRRHRRAPGGPQRAVRGVLLRGVPRRCRGLRARRGPAGRDLSGSTPHHGLTRRRSPSPGRRGKEVEADQQTGQVQQSLKQVGPLLVAQPETATAEKPGLGAPHHPRMGLDTRSKSDPPCRGLDSAFADPPTPLGHQADPAPVLTISGRNMQQRQLAQSITWPESAARDSAMPPRQMRGP